MNPSHTDSHMGVWKQHQRRMWGRRGVGDTGSHVGGHGDGEGQQAVVLQPLRHHGVTQRPPTAPGPGGGGHFSPVPKTNPPTCENQPTHKPPFVNPPSGRSTHSPTQPPAQNQATLAATFRKKNSVWPKGQARQTHGSPHLPGSGSVSTRPPIRQPPRWGPHQSEVIPWVPRRGGGPASQGDCSGCPRRRGTAGWAGGGGQGMVRQEDLMRK